VNILAVKWGKKYGADYVNKLYVGIKKYTTKAFKFYCFTDDPTGMHKEIVPIALKESWGGWWGKATLFSRGKYKVIIMLVMCDKSMEYKAEKYLLTWIL
jgi:hypothetical protein